MENPLTTLANTISPLAQSAILYFTTHGMEGYVQRTENFLSDNKTRTVNGHRILSGVAIPKYRRWRETLSEMNEGEAIRLRTLNEYNSVNYAARSLGFYTLKKGLLMFKVSRDVFEKNRRPGRIRSGDRPVQSSNRNNRWANI